MSIPKQMECFREYKSKVEEMIGTERTQALLKKAVYIISAGTNDFIVNYYGASGIRRYSYSIPSYSQFLTQQLQELIEVSMYVRLVLFSMHVHWSNCEDKQFVCLCRFIRIIKIVILITDLVVTTLYNGGTWI